MSDRHITIQAVKGSSSALLAVSVGIGAGVVSAVMEASRVDVVVGVGACFGTVVMVRACRIEVVVGVGATIALPFQ